MSREAPGVQIREVSEREYPAWDRFVRQAPQSTFCHLAEWRDVIRRAFGHRCHYLYAEQDGEIVGVLPLAQVKSRLFANALISTPFCVYGGPVAVDHTVREGLEEAAAGLARRLDVDYLEMRNLSAGPAEWVQKPLYVTFRKSLAANVEENFRAIPRKQRAMVRKGIEAGLKAEIDPGVDRLYPAYAQSLRNLGTPVFSKRYLKLLKAYFGNDCEILTVTKDGELVASVMSFYFKDEVLPYYGGGVAAARELKGNDFMYWEVMKRACVRGVRVFDYGRSKRDTGSYRFKKHWGFEPTDLPYQYLLVNAKEMPNLSPTNPRFEKAIEVWKRLPLAVTNGLGPWLARSLG